MIVGSSQVKLMSSMLLLCCSRLLGCCSMNATLHWRATHQTPSFLEPLQESKLWKGRGADIPGGCCFHAFACTIPSPSDAHPTPHLLGQNISRLQRSAKISVLPAVVSSSQPPFPARLSEYLVPPPPHPVPICAHTLHSYHLTGALCFSTTAVAPALQVPRTHSVNLIPS